MSKSESQTFESNFDNFCTKGNCYGWSTETYIQTVQNKEGDIRLEVRAIVSAPNRNAAKQLN